MIQAVINIGVVTGAFPVSESPSILSYGGLSHLDPGGGGDCLKLIPLHRLRTHAGIVLISRFCIFGG